MYRVTYFFQNVFEEDGYSNVTSLSTTIHPRQEEDGSLVRTITNIYIAATLIELIGIVCNIVVIRVMRSPGFDELPQSFLRLSLGITDLVGLVILLASKVFYYIYQTNVWNLSSYSCKAFQFGFVIAQLDILLVMCICIERIIIVSRPLEARVLLTKTRVRVMVICCAAFLVVWHFDVVFSRDLVMVTGPNNNTYYSCQCSEFFMEHVPLFCTIKDILNEVMFYVGPVVVIIILNILTIIKLRRRNLASKNLGGNERRREEQLRAVTITSLSISITLVVLLLPTFIYVIVSCLTSEAGCFHSDDVMATVFTMLSTSVSWSINFALYFLTGSLFRQELCNVVICISCVSQEGIV